MALRQIILYPDPRLIRPAALVEVFDSALSKIMHDMAETMYHENGVGLAGPQIGVMKRVTVVDVSPERNDLRFLVNPQIFSLEGSKVSEEGCLSIPDYRADVERAEKVVIKAQDEKGNPLEIEAEGLMAVCLQHEIDHLQGILFVDHLSRLKRELFKKWAKRQEWFAE